MRRARIDPKARGIVCAVKRANVIWGKGSADNIRASGASKPASTGRRHDRTHDQTQRRKKTLDQRAPSRHDNALMRARTTSATFSNFCRRLFNMIPRNVEATMVMRAAGNVPTPLLGTAFCVRGVYQFRHTRLPMTYATEPYKPTKIGLDSIRYGSGITWYFVVVEALRRQAQVRIGRATAFLIWRGGRPSLRVKATSSMNCFCRGALG